MADAIITKECIDVLRAQSRESQAESPELPDTIWRTLCADRNEKGERAPHFYQTAMLYLLGASDGGVTSHSPSDLLDQMSSIDPEELLDSGTPGFVEQFLEVVRDIVWNRRTFRLTRVNDVEEDLVGLVPQHARVGDTVCILNGCSVPVVLRKLHHPSDAAAWQLIGDAYVHGIMDGEAISSASSRPSTRSQVEYRIW